MVMCSILMSKCYKSNLTSKVRPVAETRLDETVLGDDVDDSFLHEVHLRSDGSLFDDVVARLEDFELQLRDYFRHETRIGVDKKWNRSNESATVEVDDLLEIVKRYYLT